ncbi:MAG TPA: TIGR01777 family oxidoreductase [Thermoanaerobaculia bacterium]|nr:TIGR01777 family oxidoreductase [Thermoanaerobaculia bacterium]
MKIVISGGTGFIGEALVRDLAGAHEVVVLSRSPGRVRVGRGVGWDASPGGAWEGELGDAGAVVNLAGESIGEGRWTEKKKRALVESRLNATRALVGAMRARPREGRVLVSASAIGYYGDRGDEVLEESSPPGDDFLARLCRQWENEAREAESVGRVVITRFGIVLGRDGGALPRMALPVRLFVGGRVGSGEQWMSWVHRRDLVRLVRWAIERRDASGVYNVAAPNPVKNRELIAVLASVLHRPAIFPAPAFALRIALGEMADALLLSSQRVVPRRASIEQFTFDFPDLKRALRDIYS